ncbi:MAG: hypothetical protein ACTSUS_08395 [Candidatus Freyarchaeota archaeon]|nr:hypothetical protein [Candidatus Freyrarchaeum guaymaensis]HDO80820.1 hypothetical protein [Candidatus Bathyarchaeota archaeon]
MGESKVRLLEEYIELRRKGRDEGKAVSLYVDVIKHVGELLSKAFYMKARGKYQESAFLFTLCSSILEVEGLHERAAILLLKAGDCLFAKGCVREAFECFLRGYKEAVSAKPSKLSRFAASLSLLLMLFTALKMHGLVSYKEALKKAREIAGRRLWRSIRRTKYYRLARDIMLRANGVQPPNMPHDRMVLEELAEFRIGDEIKSWFQLK